MEFDIGWNPVRKVIHTGEQCWKRTGNHYLNDAKKWFSTEYTIKYNNNRKPL